MLEEIYVMSEKMWNERSLEKQPYSEKNIESIFIRRSVRSIFLCICTSEILKNSTVYFGKHFNGQYKVIKLEKVKTIDMTIFEAFFNQCLNIIEQLFIYYKTEKSTKTEFLNITKNIMFFPVFELNCPCCNKTLIIKHDNMNTFVIENDIECIS